MSTRERWIVYPLLFFAFCLAVKAQPNLVQDGRFQSISCEELTVKLPTGKPCVRIGSTFQQSGSVSIYGRQGRPAVVLTAGRSGEGVLETFNGRDGQAAVIGATDDGGLLQLKHADGKRLLLLGFGKESMPWGLFSVHSDGRTRPLAADATLTDTNLVPLDDPDQDANDAAEQPEEDTQQDETDSTPDSAAGAVEEPANFGVR